MDGKGEMNDIAPNWIEFIPGLLLEPEFFGFKIYNLRNKDVQVLVLQKYVWQNHT